MILQKLKNVQNTQNEMENHSVKVKNWTFFGDNLLIFSQIWSGEFNFLFLDEKIMSSVYGGSLKICEKSWKKVENHKKLSISETYTKEKHFSFLQIVPNKT